MDASAATRSRHDARQRRTSELIDRAHATDDPRLRADLLDQVVILNQCVAEAIANRYRNRGVPHEDLVQAACEGLVKAVHKFDPKVRPDLLTYAVPTIRGEVQRWFRDRSWMVRPPRRIQELQRRVSQSIDRLAPLGRPPTDEELSTEARCTVSELHEAIQAFGCFRPPSLDLPSSANGDMDLGSTIAAQDDGQSAADARVLLSSVLPTLPERDRRILYLRFFEDLDQSEIGADLGVRQTQVSRLLERILRDLRTQLAS